MNFVEAASGLAGRLFDNRRVEQLRDMYLLARSRMAPLLRAWYGTFDAADLRAHLESRIGKDFEILMVHSSVNHMLPMYTGTPLDLVRMLVDLCGPTRTLAMPAFYFGEAADGGAAATFKKAPRFDMRRTPSQMGLATELFRRMPGVVQSRHPIYRISALGPRAAELTRGHELAATAAGAGTPFEFMKLHDTCIIGIGKPMQVLTQAHHTEAFMGDAFPVPSTPADPIVVTVVDKDQEFLVSLIGRAYQGRFNIWRLRKIMTADSLREWQFHGVPMFSTKAADVSGQLEAAALRGLTLYETDKRFAELSAAD